MELNYQNKFAIIIIFIEFLLFLSILYRLNNRKFEFYYSKYLCSLLILSNSNTCVNEILNNYDFFYYVKDTRKNVILSINNRRGSLIENIMIIIGIIPFLNEKSVIIYHINTDETNKIYQILFDYKNISYGKIYIDFNDFKTVKKKFNILIDYIWEFIPQKKLLDNIRYIISNYYDDSCLYIFEKALNRNYEYYLKKKNVSNSLIKELVSK